MKKELGIAVLLAVLCAVTAAYNPQFLSPTNLRNTANLIGIYGIFSIGLGLVIITGGIDLSVGSVFALQGVVMAMLLCEAKWPWPLVLLAAIAGVTAIGAFHGWLVAYIRMQPFIVTLCGLLFYRGIARFVANDGTKGFGTAEGFESLRTIATGSVGSVPMPFVLLVICAVAMYLLLHRSVYGRYLFAVGRNEDAARYSGINSRRIIASAYVVSMGLARSRACCWPSTPTRSRRRATATSTSCTALPRPFWAAAACVAAKARLSA